ncbi:MAG: hypothetical protein K0R84_32 [Clostridia bacterium]|nr:hypothetical protein [Clostridia bacterium]
MKYRDISELDPKLKIGSNCFFMNISAILEYKNMLSMSLSYINFDFIYNPDHFTEFVNPKPTEEYISKENELLVVGSIDSLFRNDHVEYISKGMKDYNLFSLHTIDPELLLDLGRLDQLYLKQKEPIVYSNDHYYVYNDYTKTTSDMAHYHSQGHAATMVKVDFSKKTCCVIDKFFSFIGEIPISSYFDAVTSDFLTQRTGHYVQIERMKNMTEDERLRILLKNNINNSMQKTVTINGTKYYKNLDALALLLQNFERHLHELSEQKGKYAPQFTTKLFSPVRLNKVGFGNLMPYIKRMVNTKETRVLEPLCKEVASLWVRIDVLCDKCYLTNSTILEYKDRLLDTYKEIYEKEKVIFDQLSALEAKLW